MKKAYKNKTSFKFARDTDWKLTGIIVFETDVGPLNLCKLEPLTLGLCVQYKGFKSFTLRLVGVIKNERIKNDDGKKWEENIIFFYLAERWNVRRILVVLGIFQLSPPKHVQCLQIQIGEEKMASTACNLPNFKKITSYIPFNKNIGIGAGTLLKC